jgi:hypothetical protein
MAVFKEIQRTGSYSDVPYMTFMVGSIIISDLEKQRLKQDTGIKN